MKLRSSILLAALPLAITVPAPRRAGYVGSEACGQCHDDVAGSSLLMARALGMAGQPEQRIEWLSRAVALDPDGVGGRLQLGAALFAASRWDEAALQFRAAAEINPLSAPAYFNLAQTEAENGRREEAERLLRIARALDPRLDR